MGAPIIGRTACPECGFENAHVKRSAKCVYRYCPECGAMYHATGADREKRLMERTRLTEPVAAPAPTSTPTEVDPPAAPAPGPTPTPTETPPPTPTPTEAPRKRRGLF